MAMIIVGNSHVIALRSAVLSSAVDPLDVRSYYPMPGGWQVDQIKTRGRLVPRLINCPATGRDEGVLLDDIDGLVVSAVGYGAARNQFVEIESPRHPLAFMASADWGYVPSRVPGCVRLISVTAFEAAVEGWIRKYHTTQMLQRLTEVCDCRIFVQPWPAPSRVLKTDPGWFLNRWYGELGAKAWLSFFVAQRSAVKAVVHELGSRVILLDYPFQSTIEDGFMDESFCDRDPFHANKEYGALVIRQIASQL